MSLSRREFPAAFLMVAPALQAAQDSGGQNLPSKVYVFDEMQVHHTAPARAL